MCEYNTCTCTNSSHFRWLSNGDLIVAQCNEERIVLDQLPPSSRLTLDFVFWGNDRPGSDIMSFIFVVSVRKASKTKRALYLFFPFPASPLLSWQGSAAVTDIHVSSDPPSPPSPPSTLLHISILPFPFARYIFLLMINPRYKPPPVSPVRLSFLPVTGIGLNLPLLSFFNEVSGSNNWMVRTFLNT